VNPSRPNPVTAPPRPGRLLVVLPSWLGDAAMATPTLRLLRDSLPGSFIVGLARPAVADLLDGSPLLDEIVIERASGVMGPKRVAAKVRPLRFDAALLLTNSFSTALATRIAGIPRRVGYDRDGRAMLLTQKLRALELPGSTARNRRWTPISAVVYYYAAGRALLGDPAPTLTASSDVMGILPTETALELPLRDTDRAAGRAVLTSAGVEAGTPFCVLNPGANNPAKRWASDRFGGLADHLARQHGLRILINTGPGEKEVARAVAEACSDHAPVVLADHGQTLAALKAILARARLLVTNDTGPRHLAAAFGTPTVALFGPTDPRWTTLPERNPGSDPPREIRLAAGQLGPTPLEEGEVADEHPDRCGMEIIGVRLACDAADRVLGLPGG
jgi:heptosyltransferase-2